MRRLLVCGLCGVFCSACATAPDRPVLHETLVPLIATCHPAISPSLEAPDTDQALLEAPDLFARVRLLLAGRLVRIARQRDLEAALQGCAEPSSGASAP